MTRTAFLILWILIATGILTFMVLAWRSRTRRYAALAQPETELLGDILARFTHANYVSTTPIGQPLERVIIPGLSFKGWADVTVRRDGVEVAVTGERPVQIAASQLLGTDTAKGRIGKVVEADGLALLQWRGGAPAADRSTATAGAAAAASTALESSFRFSEPSEQRRFARAVAEITPTLSQHTSTAQEDA